MAPLWMSMSWILCVSIIMQNTGNKQEELKVLIQEGDYNLIGKIRRVEEHYM